MKKEMMSKILIKWLCMPKSLQSEINNLNKKRWSVAITLKKKNKKILWLKLIDLKLLNNNKKLSDNIKLNKK